MTSHYSGKDITYVLYDGISNSVFHSQVLKPILTLLEKFGDVEVTLVSFEKKMSSREDLARLIPAHDRLHFVLCRKIPFVGKISLLFASYQFLRLLRYVKTSHIVARGPLAGWITSRVVGKLCKIMGARCWLELPKLTIQARGLAAEEFRYVLEEKKYSWLRRLLNDFLCRQYEVIETEVYKGKVKTVIPEDITIEAVSPALKKYLVEHFDADLRRVVLSHQGIPDVFEKNVVNKWREEVRNELGINNIAYVYCYAGSAHSWQCVDEMIDYFVEAYKKDKNSFFLIYSQDVEVFKEKLQKTIIPITHYIVKRIKPENIYKYLSAADVGMLFRKKDLINWVARPTKMLEYRAVGLDIAHNNTVAWLVDSNDNCK